MNERSLSIAEINAIAEYCVWAGQHPSDSDRQLNNPHQGVILAFKPHLSDYGTREITAIYCATWILRSVCSYTVYQRNPSYLQNTTVTNVLLLTCLCVLLCRVFFILFFLAFLVTECCSMIMVK